MSLEQARQEASEYLLKLDKGIDPKVEKEQVRWKRAVDEKKNITLQEAFDTMLADQASRLKPKTLTWYQDIFDRYLADWHQRPVLSITKKDIIEKHTSIAKDAEKRNARGLDLKGTYAANAAMRTLRVALYYARDILDIPLEPLFPALRKKWHKEQPRDRIIEKAKGEFPLWWQTVETIEDKTASNALKVIMLAGLRPSSEALCLKWENVDMKYKILTITETKTGNTHKIPMGNELKKIFESQKKIAGKSDFVFPSSGVTKSKSGHITDLNRPCDKISEALGRRFSPYDLRHTFVTLAQGLVTYSEAARLVNHKTALATVHEGYMKLTVEDLRTPMERIEGEIMGLVGGKVEGNVITMHG